MSENQKPKLIKDLGMLYPKETSKLKRRYGLYECPICLNQYKTATSDVKRNSSTRCRSCSSSVKNKKHGMRYHNLYSVWAEQRNRCSNAKHKFYKDYGGRGIKFSSEFDDFAVWFEYVESLEDANKEKYTIDRIDNDLGYQRGNLRWANKNTQSRNTRKIHKSNTSGYRGVSFNKKADKCVAYIVVNKKQIHLGTFNYNFTAAYAYDSYILKNNLEHTRNF